MVSMPDKVNPIMMQNYSQKFEICYDCVIMHYIIEFVKISSNNLVILSLFCIEFLHQSSLGILPFSSNFS